MRWLLGSRIHGVAGSSGGGRSYIVAGRERRAILWGAMKILALAVALFCFTAFGQTGTAVPTLASFDQLMTSILSRYNIPGGSIALTQNGRLVFARGYGFADAQKQIVAQPDSRYRIASLTKAITAVTVMHLAEQGLLNLDQPAFDLLPDLQPPPGSTVDPRLSSITIRNLLNHAGGWDDTATGLNFDPMFNSATICAALGVTAPASTENIIRYMRGQPLQFDPGTHGSCYSNFGYAVLGRIIERVTKMSYEQYVRENVLAPMGISQMRIGQTLPNGQLPNEVKYKSPGNANSVFPDVASPVAWPYGGWYLESMDSHGGWVASAIKYSKFLNAIDGRRGQRFLSASSVAQLTTRPATVNDWKGTTYWYGFGLLVNTAGNWWHSGSLDGTATYHIRTNDGFVWVVFLNYRGDNATAQNNLFTDIDSGLWNAAGQVTSWPTGDQFANYPDAPAQTTQSQPALTTREGVVNGATFDRGIVSGSWLTLFGANLAGKARTWTAADIVNGNLPTSLDNVSVTINGQPAFVYYVSPTQINAQAPAGLQPGWVTASVTYNGVSTGNILTHAVLNAPGALTYLAGGNTFAVATAPDGTVIGDPSVTPGTRFAAPGLTVVMYASGLAVSAAGVAAPPAINLTSATQVKIGAVPASISFAGLISPGLFQINAVVPAVSDGYQPVAIQLNGTQSPAGVSLAVHH